MFRFAPAIRTGVNRAAAAVPSGTSSTVIARSRIASSVAPASAGTGTSLCPGHTSNMEYEAAGVRRWNV